MTRIAAAEAGTFLHVFETTWREDPSVAKARFSAADSKGAFRIVHEHMSRFPDAT